jgi:hypothetical protein
MKTISVEILDFLKKYFDRMIEPVHFSNLSKQYIQTLFELIYEADIEWSKSIIETNVLTTYNFIYGSYFNQIEFEIQEYILNATKIIKQYKFTMKDREYTIHIIYPFDNDSILSQSTLKRIYRKMDRQIRLVYISLYVGTYMATKLCKGPLNVYIYMTPYKKQMPQNSAILDSIHANTGFTYIQCKIPTEIHVYREEEWLKVFIHESFHNLNLDFATISNSISKNIILSLFPVNSDVNLTETYSEMWAEILNNMLIVYEKSKVMNVDRMIHKLEEMLKYERIFSLFQAIKILNHYNLKYQNMFENTKHAIQLRKSYKENTNVLSYYIIKSIFMFNVNEYIEWTLKHNGSMQFKLTNKNVELYCHFVEGLYKNEKYILYSNAIDEWLTRKRLHSTPMKTLRMSIFEI